MPTGKNWFHFIFIQLIFIVGTSFLVILSFIKQIKSNWNQYRCNPLFMPLSNNVELDFTYCVQNMQKQMMGNFLQPFEWILSNMGELGTSFTSSINDVRQMFGNIRFFSIDIVTSIYGVFMNLVIEIQKLVMGIRDLTKKIVATLASIIYIMEGVMKTLTSTWNGPIGDLVRGVGKMSTGGCFHPDTLLKLKDGGFVKVQDIHLGDVLQNGSRVKATMKIDNSNYLETMYLLPKMGENNEDIFVTGSHYIKSTSGQFIRVDEDPRAVKQADQKLEWFSCLITDNHLIQIGQLTFWDWDDYPFHYNINKKEYK